MILTSGRLIVEGKITDQRFFESVNYCLDNCPKLLAEGTGREQFLYFDKLKAPPPSMKVEKISEIYGQKLNCGDKEKRQALTTWNEFMSIMRKQDPIKTLADIEQRHVEAYHSWVHAQLGSKWKAPTIKRRLVSIKTQLRYALKRSTDKAAVRRVLDFTELFDNPNGHNGTNPQPISVADFHKLLKACKQTPTVDSVLWECLLLCSLNFCFYPIDLSGLEPQHVKDGTLIYPRKKTGVMRVGVFWKRTAAALAAYQAKHAHGLPTIFATYHRGEYSRLAKSTLNRQFEKIRDKAGLSVTMNHIRDGGQTWGCKGKGSNLATILMGHKLPGVTDAYLARDPEHVADACKAIEAHYFSGGK